MRFVERVAVIDMGSNSWRLVVFGYEPHTPWWSLVDEIREPVRVSAGMREEGAIRPERFELALHTAAVFSAFCRASGVNEIEAVATSAIRDAANGPELLERIKDHTGLEPRVISGVEEARYVYDLACRVEALLREHTKARVVATVQGKGPCGRRSTEHPNQRDGNGITVPP